MPIKPTKTDSTQNIRATKGDEAQKVTSQKKQSVGQTNSFSTKKKIEQPAIITQKPILSVPTQTVNFNKLDDVKEKMERPLDKKYVESVFQNSVTTMYPGFPQGKALEKKIEELRPLARGIMEDAFSEKNLERLPQEMKAHAKEIQSFSSQAFGKSSDMETIMSIMILISELQSARSKMNLTEMKSLSDKQHAVLKESQTALVTSQERAGTAEGISKANNIVGIVLGIGGLALAALSILALGVAIVASLAVTGLTFGAAAPILIAVVCIGVPLVLGALFSAGSLVFNAVSMGVGQEKVNEFVAGLLTSVLGISKEDAEKAAPWVIMGVQLGGSIAVFLITIAGAIAAWIATFFSLGLAAPVGAAATALAWMQGAAIVGRFTQSGAEAITTVSLGVPQTVYAYETLRFQSDSLGFKKVSEEIEKQVQHALNRAKEAIAKENEFMKMVIKMVDDMKNTVLKVQSNI
ncbi:MAG: hypothetical protein COZ46_01275 [Verrucomicrobia bacterium CG_4_10_14_3_um_filter_43_23]|nr:MAG: hypothetical protein COX01_02880 [Verrucomicrobia bacterium CG22_combo_CG10-13_8_21_14_all_43_17]PIX58836.1 MAG: hypothetical protein COZ46_01275 [Verrucomicrobia bacterium CG_4_10_14_3_um_filter_43_23]PIY60931.1 MAG: hypothetical protein COY94_07955 [Verrucomicrobia bacterium CG_4_10_14_0_8_um_filter_43_34]PJA44845.1 MAG: hypothetical protein CO175_00765 [Verrucomicrobia bacterium CG_4_9_14_3_um_filter_43_20]